MRRLLITGTHSGCGKTTVACAVLAAFKARGLDVTAFKCGPDYIDPMFHRSVSGVKAYNLDPFFMEDERLAAHLAEYGSSEISATCNEVIRALSLLEGAMGYYDGIANTDKASPYTVTKATKTPAVLVADVRGMGNSLGALLEGFVHYRGDSGIRGVIFNGINESRYPDMRRITESVGLEAFGWLPRNVSWQIESRHLGLTTAAEIPGIQEKLFALGRQAENSIDVDSLLALADSAPDLPILPGGPKLRRVTPSVFLGESLLQQPEPPTLSGGPSHWQPESPPLPTGGGLRLAVARDEAFCFLYAENLDLLERLGCELVFFSPIQDKALPPDLQGLYLCGGYPELYTQTLSDNTSMREDIRRVINRGLPTIAECGGFLYLHETLDDYPMAAIISGKAWRTDRLQRFGYITLTAEQDNLLCKAGESIRSHEFHYWESDNSGDGFIAAKAGRENAYPCIHAGETLYAGFPHLYFLANPNFARSFVERMAAYKKSAAGVLP
ncbi:cobyrinic Acid a,c-diamide synthase [Treponema primitia ZAS-2]|uniref:Cobyrinic Acid a,c-diamide synthase n=1 Tax=Treponema primitia (strain ATCC BAA-887 / DSM 12427 / ZAS-2) TaxID=545694 RepID=F5YLB6_TREPZ|nr:cobyrinate a,c-diamide synthase [Treponema primitia]AEF84519.1 cobyrinic Acid a,c-diamide synthase [Treponema primitia ZAS-2]